MTTTDALHALLEESDVTADDALDALLADLQALGAGPVPEPGPELAALLVGEPRGRRRIHRRGAVIGALVVLSLGTGVTAAAASPDVRDGAIGAVAAVVHVLRPPAAVQHRPPAPSTTQADVPVARHSEAPAPQSSASVRAAVPAAHPSVPGDDRTGTHGDRARDHARTGEGHEGAPGSSGSDEGTRSRSGSSGRGSGLGSSGGSADSGSQASGSDGNDSGNDSGTDSGSDSGSHYDGGSNGAHSTGDAAGAAAEGR